ncbi:MAG: glycosyltransferase family 4 protein [Candidatus Hodarchaeota archaeon]
MIVGPLSDHAFFWKRMYESHQDQVFLVSFEPDFLEIRSRFKSDSLKMSFYQQINRIKRLSKMEALKFLCLRPWLFFIGLYKTHGRDVIHYIAYKYYAKQLRYLINKFHPDIIHSHYISSTGFIVKETGFHPFITSIWGSDLYFGIKKINKTRWLKEYIQEVALIHALTERQKEYLVQYGVPPEKIFSANWGVNIDSIVPSKDQVQSIRFKFGIKENQKVILCPRRLDDMFNIRMLFDIAIATVQQNSDLVFIFGSYGPYKNELQQLVKQRNLSDQIIIPGYLPDDEFNALFGLADLYLQTPNSDGVAITLMQAMVNRLPILTTNVGDTSANIHDGITGLFIQPDLNEIKEKIGYLLSNPEVREQLGENAYDWALKHCNSEKNFQLLHEKLQNLVMN